MARFYFHLRGGGGLLMDESGIELEADQVSARAISEARALLAADLPEGVIDLSQVMEVADGDGEIIHRLRFSDAVAINGSDGAA